MPPLTVVEMDPAAPDARAEEFVYLRRLRTLAIDRAVGATRAVEGASGSPLPPPTGGPALLVLSPRVYAGEPTIRAMAERVGRGVDAAAPHLLSALDRSHRRPVHSLRGFERVEGQVLAQPPDDVPTGPLLLLSEEAWSAIPRDVPAATAVEALPRPTAVGLCHDFVTYFGSIREDVLPLIPQDAREILEVGCGGGGTGAALKERQRCHVTGIEHNPEAAALARRRLDRVIFGDAATVDLGGPYDAALALELFEHLVEPDLFLRRLRTAVRPGGRIVLSTPNIGHWSVVEDLLAGRWDYLPMGHHCSTHVRFFTAHTLRDWVEMAGFTDHRIVPRTGELPEPWDGPLPAQADRDSLRTVGFFVELVA